jgi:hypothetical protein
VGAHKWACNNTPALCRILYFFHSSALVACKCGLIQRYVQGERHEENNQIRHVTGTTLVGVGMRFAQAPVTNIDRYRRGNLASVQSRYRSGEPKHQPSPTGERWSAGRPRATGERSARPGGRRVETGRQRFQRRGQVVPCVIFNAIGDSLVCWCHRSSIPIQVPVFATFQ